MAISQNVVPYQISDFYFMRSQMGLGLPSSISNLAVHGDMGRTPLIIRGWQ